MPTETEVVETVEEWEEERNGVTVTVRKKTTRTTRMVPTIKKKGYAPIKNPNHTNPWHGTNPNPWQISYGVNTTDSKTDSISNTVA